MAVVEIRKPFEVFNDTNGNPLEGGFVYIGVSGSEAQSTPKAVYWDSGLTIPASQPLRTRNGSVVNSNTGNPAPYFTDGAYSITVKDEQGITIASRLVNSDGAVTLGTMATQNTGTAGTEFRTNAQNDARFLLASAYSQVAQDTGIIMNGNFAVNQRFITVFPNYIGFTADRWFIEGVNLGAATWTTTIAENNPLPFANYRQKNMFNIVFSGFAVDGEYLRLRQRIENWRALAGETISICGWGGRGTTGTIAVSAVANYGTGGGPSSAVTINGSTATLTPTNPGNEGRFCIPLTIPTSTLKSFGTNNDDYLEIRIWFAAGSSFAAETGATFLDDGSVTLGNIHLRLGAPSISALDDYVEPDPAVELARCQRYFMRLENVARLSTGTPLIGQVTFPVAMRATPTVTPTYGSGTGATWAQSTTGMVQNTAHSHSAIVTRVDLSAEL